MLSRFAVLNRDCQTSSKADARKEESCTNRTTREKNKRGTEGVGNPRVEALSRAEITETYIMQCFFYESYDQSLGVLNENGPMGSCARGFSPRALLQYIRISSDLLAQADSEERLAVTTALCHFEYRCPI